MTYDRKQWRDSLPTASADHLRGGFALPPQAAVQAEHLMADPHWGVYQQMLQGAAEALEASRAALVKRLWAPADAVTTAALQCEIARISGAIDAFTSAITLPRQLLESHEKAAEGLGATVTRLSGETTDARG